MTFEQARAKVASQWPDYKIAPYGYETATDWLLILLPETTGGRIPAVAKASGTIRWINENSAEYSQRHPVGEFPASRP